MNELGLLFLLVAQTATTTTPSQVTAGPPIPAWGWVTIVVALAGTVTTMAGVTYRSLQQVIKAKDETITRADAEQARQADINTKSQQLLERAIAAFVDSRNVSDTLAELLKELKQEVRNVGEKVS